MVAGESNTNKIAYNASITLTFLVNNITVPIATERIKYIVIDSNFETEIMPKIYMNISVDANLYDYITNYKNDGKFKLKIQRKNLFSRTSLSDVILDETFTYIPSTTNSDYLKDISEGGVSDDSYRNIVIGLISEKITNAMRKSFNPIYNNIDTETLIGLATEGLDIVTQPITYNTKYNEILIPPVSSRKEFLEFIFHIDNFYDTEFLFFMDFKRAYLLARDGKGVTNTDDPINDVYIDIKALTSDSSYYDGINMINNSYYVYVNPVNSNVIVPDGMSKIANRLIVLDDDKDLQILDVNLNNNYESSIKDVFIRADNGSIYKNQMEQENVLVEISKSQVDGYSFTPNKVYIVNNFGNYSKYNGKYIISGKKEYYRVTAGGDFVTSCYLVLRKVTTIATKQNITSLDRSNRAVKTSSQLTNSADEIYNTNIKPVNRRVY